MEGVSRGYWACGRKVFQVLCWLVSRLISVSFRTVLGSPCLQQQTIGIMPAYHRAGKGMVSPHQCKEHYIFTIMTKTGQIHFLYIAYSEAKFKKKECLHISRPVQLKTSKIHFLGPTLTALNFGFSCPNIHPIWPCKDIGEIISVSQCTCKIALWYVSSRTIQR